MEKFEATINTPEYLEGEGSRKEKIEKAQIRLAKLFNERWQEA